MRKLILYIAATLDGKIAGLNGNVDFLDAFSDGDYGYQEFDNQVDAVIMGYRTYEKSLELSDNPFPNKEYYVLTRKIKLPDDNRVYFVNGDLKTFYNNLAGQDGKKSIWLMGGGELIRSFLNAGIKMDELLIFVVPILLGKGIEMFPASFDMQTYQLKEVIGYPNGMVKLHYII